MYAQEKLVNQGPDKLTETELLAVLISNESAAEEIMTHFGGFKGMANQPLEKFLRFPRMGPATIIRLSACFEIAKRIVAQVLESEAQTLRP